MKKSIMLFSVVVLIGAALAQTPPKLSDSAKLAISRAQVEQLQAQGELNNIVQQFTQSPAYVAARQRVDDAQKRTQKAVDDAFAAAKLSEADYDIDKDLNLAPKPKPAAPKAATPTAQDKK